MFDNALTPFWLPTSVFRSVFPLPELGLTCCAGVRTRCGGPIFGVRKIAVGEPGPALLLRALAVGAGLHAPAWLVRILRAPPRSKDDGVCIRCQSIDARARRHINAC